MMTLAEREVSELQSELAEAEEQLYLTKASYDQVNRLLQDQCLAMERELVKCKVRSIIIHGSSG